MLGIHVQIIVILNKKFKRMLIKLSTINDYEELKEKIEDAKTSMDKASGAKEKIEDISKKDYDISINDIDSKIEILEKDISKKKIKKEKIIEELETLFDWEEL
jgi:hypothetical protein